MAHSTPRNSAPPGAHSHARGKRAAASSDSARTGNGQGKAAEAEGQRRWIRSETRELPEVRRLMRTTRSSSPRCARSQTSTASAW